MRLRLLILGLICSFTAFAQAPASQLPLPRWQPLDNNSRPVPGGKICTYVTGGFSSPLATYTSSAANVQNSNPIILDSAGRANVWFGNGETYRVVFQQPGDQFCPGTGASIWTQDGVSNAGQIAAAAVLTSLSTPAGSGLVGYSQTNTYPAGTVGKRLERVINVADAPYGAIANGTGTAGTSQTSIFQAAMNDLHTGGGGELFVPWSQLCYSLDYPGVTLYSDITVYGDSQATCIQVTPGAFSSWAGGWALFSNDATVTGAVNIHIRNLTLDGNRANITGLSASNLNAFGVAFLGASNSSVENSVIENAGDGVYLDCSGSPRTTQGTGATVRGNVITNNQRNNVSFICGTNTVIADNSISLANGASPQAGIDVEENIAGQAVPNHLITGNLIFGNTAQGIVDQPAHDSANTVNSAISNNMIFGNGVQGIEAINFTGNQQSIQVTGNNVTGNTGVQLLLENWTNSVYSGIAAGGPVGLSMTAMTNVSVGGFLSGSSYDLEFGDTISSGMMAGVGLAHCTVHGGIYFTGFANCTALDPTTTNAFGYRTFLNVPPSVAMANGNNINCTNAVIGSGGSVTAQRCLSWDDLTGGSFNIGAQGNVSWGANKFNLNMSGTGKNYFASGIETLPVNFSVVTALITCNGTNSGHQYPINDAISAVFNSTITGGGANVGIAFCNGTNWVFH